MERIPINKAWEFVTKEGSKWVNIPHTVTETPYNYFDESIYQMKCEYKRSISAPETWKNKRVFIHFGAVAHKAEVYINDSLAGIHLGGYTQFRIEITKYLRLGESNTLSVKVDSNESLNIPPFGYVIDYMTYGGIYRGITLEIEESSYIKDMYITSEVPKDCLIPSDTALKMTETESWLAKFNIEEGVRKQRNWLEKNHINLRADVALNLVCGEDMPESIAVTVSEWDDEKGVAGGSLATKNFTIDDIKKGDDIGKIFDDGLSDDEGTHTFLASLDVQGVKLWDVLSPVRYLISVRLLKGEKILDERTARVGFRSAKFKKDGFFLNGRRLKLRGLNRHQSFAYVGYAMPESMQREDVRILKDELACNIVRTSHYPMSEYFYDECDKRGLLVFTEIPGWQHVGDDEWKKIAVANVAEMITQCRHHPSVIIWGVRINESMDDDKFYTETNALAHKLDPYRQTGGVRYIKKSSLLEDVYTYNDFIHTGDNEGCDKIENVTPDHDKPYYISEYAGHMFPTKPYDDEIHRVDHAMFHRHIIDAIAAEDSISGSTGWCMFDYNTHKDFGSGDRICYHGVMDMFRNPKLAASVYACFGDEPVLTVCSSMDIGEHPGGNIGDVLVFTNADSVRLYVNDEFHKTYFRDPLETAHLPYAPIRIKDIEGEWGKGGTTYRFEIVKFDRVIKSVTKGPVKSLHIEAIADHTSMIEKDTFDVAAVRIRMLDQFDNVLPYFNGVISLSVSGPIELIGPKTIALSGGMGGTYVKSIDESGGGTLTISSDQADDVTIDFTVSISSGTAYQ